MKRFPNGRTCFGLAKVILFISYLTSSATAQPIAAEEEPSAKQSEKQREYIDWLEARSMLSQSVQLSRVLSGKGAQWQHEFAEPKPRAAIKQASVWLLEYPA